MRDYVADVRHYNTVWLLAALSGGGLGEARSNAREARLAHSLATVLLHCTQHHTTGLPAPGQRQPLFFAIGGNACVYCASAFGIRLGCDMRRHLGNSIPHKRTKA